MFDEQLLTRRGVLKTGAVAIVALGLPQAVRAAPEATRMTTPTGLFRSRPDLQPPTVAVTTPYTGGAGYLFVAPLAGPGQYGPLILDRGGQPLWFHPVAPGMLAASFSVQTLHGQRVLAWWEGQTVGAWGQGSYVLLDGRYRNVARVRAGNGYQADLHDFQLTPQGTALITVYNNVTADLTAYGGPEQGTVVEGVVQEIDVRTGRVIFEWHSFDHVGLDESYRTYPTNPDQFDYFHLNSVSTTADGQLLISGRHTSTLYKVDRTSGKVIWRLGGKKSDFAMGSGTTFEYQHHSRARTKGVITVFDNASYSAAAPPSEPASRALELLVDETAKTALLRRALVAPSGGVAHKMGSIEKLSDGGTFVGWGDLPTMSEYGPSGELRFAASFMGGGYTYRAFRNPWVGRPQDTPAVHLETNPDGTVDAFVSWNGATNVSSWRARSGANHASLNALPPTRRTGFETQIPLGQFGGVAVIDALDAHGRVLAASAPAVTG